MKSKEKIPSKEDTIKAILKAGISEKVLNAEFVKIKKEMSGYVENEDVLMYILGRKLNIIKKPRILQEKTTEELTKEIEEINKFYDEVYGSPEEERFIDAQVDANIDMEYERNKIDETVNKKFDEFKKNMALCHGW